MRRMYTKRVTLLVTGLLLAACAGCIAPRSEPTPAAGPVIHYLRANVEEADPGDTIVLAWESAGGTKAILYPIPPSGQLPQSGWEVDATGTYTHKRLALLSATGATFPCLCWMSQGATPVLV